MPARELLIAKALGQMARYPQYANHFDDFVLVKIKKNIRTKMGFAFLKDEVTIAAPVTRTDLLGIENKVTTTRQVWSFTNAVDTLIKEKDLEVL